MVSKQRQERGFTIIELMLALVFIAFILLFIILASIQMMRSYNKGLTVKSVSQVSRTMLDTMSRDIAQSSVVSLNKQAGTTVGMLCTDKAVYAWNGLNPPSTNSQRNTYQNNVDIPLSFVRVNDASVCRSGGVNNAIPFPYGSTTTTTSTTLELLSRQTAVLDVQLTPIVPKVYRLTIRLGSANSDLYVTDNGQEVCRPDTFGDYCAQAELSTTIYMPKGV